MRPDYIDITIAKDIGSMNRSTRSILVDTAVSIHVLDGPVVGWSQRNKRSFMMNNTDMMNHTGGWMSGGMWIWTVIGILVVVLLVVVIIKVSKK